MGCRPSHRGWDLDSEGAVGFCEGFRVWVSGRALRVWKLRGGKQQAAGLNRGEANGCDVDMHSLGADQFSVPKP